LYVNFKKLCFKNILSYGSNLQEIDFKSGLNLVSGKNGHGKCLEKSTKINVNAEPFIIEKLVSFIKDKNSLPNPLC
jgi:hypothetical protein